MSARHNGGPAFPCVEASQNNTTGETTVHQWGSPGVTMRDYFAVKAPTDEIQEYLHRQLSRSAMEKLAGRPYPQKPDDYDHGNRNAETVVAHQIEILRFLAEVNAAIRYIAADAMLAAREVQS